MDAETAGSRHRRSGLRLQRLGCSGQKNPHENKDAKKEAAKLTHHGHCLESPHCSNDPGTEPDLAAGHYALRPTVRGGHNPPECPAFRLPVLTPDELRTESTLESPEPDSVSQSRCQKPPALDSRLSTLTSRFSMLDSRHPKPQSQSQHHVHVWPTRHAPRAPRP